MKNEIINLAPVSISDKSFKDARLNAATQRIAAIYKDAVKFADEKNREIAKILAIVAEEKSYQTDGFKSVADYANSVFGIARQNAYALATAGKVYNDEKAPEAYKAMSPSKIAEVASLPAATIKSALESGDISAAKTQKELREFASKAKNVKEGQNDKAEVLDTYTARPCLNIIPESMAQYLNEHHTMEDWNGFFQNQLAGLTSSDIESVETVKLSKGHPDPAIKKKTVDRVLYFNRYYSIVVEYSKYSPKQEPSTKEEDKREYTVAELEKMLEEARKSAATSNVVPTAEQSAKAKAKVEAASKAGKGGK